MPVAESQIGFGISTERIIERAAGIPDTQTGSKPVILQSRVGKPVRSDLQ